MELKGRPRLFKGPAAASDNDSRIIHEFSCGKYFDELAGGLLSLSNRGDHLRLAIYCVDGPVKIVTPRDPLRDSAAEMLVTLEDIVEWLETGMINDVHYDEASVLDEARRIIAKAKGEKK